MQSLNRQRVNFDLYDEKAYKNLKTHLTAAKYAQFTVPVESYTAPIAKLFLTQESTPRGPAPTGSTVMESA